MEANGRLQRSSNKGLWPECLVQAAARDFRPLRVLRLANGRLERANNRGLWRQTAGCNALAAGLWRERLVQAAVRDFRPFKGFKAAGLNGLTTEGYGGKRQAATL